MFFRGWGSIQEWGSNNVDTVYIYHTVTERPKSIVRSNVNAAASVFLCFTLLQSSFQFDLISFLIR